MTGLPSSIKVFPLFPDTAFFSGEEFICTLTFKNVAEPSPASSAASLSPVLGLKNAGRNGNPRFAGVEWMAEAGRSASDGVGTAPGARILSPHSRSFSTVGQGGAERPRSNNTQRNHARSQSMAVSPVSTEPQDIRKSPLSKERMVEGDAPFAAVADFKKQVTEYLNYQSTHTQNLGLQSPLQLHLTQCLPPLWHKSAN